MNEALRTETPVTSTETDGRGPHTENLPSAIELELTVQDPDTVLELCKFPDGEPRDQFALQALRIGVLALKQARGEIDGERIRRESDRLLQNLHHRLDDHAGRLHERLTETLKVYFDPNDGRFQERVERLVKQDGELEQLLRRQIGNKDSELCKTLTAHFGEDSPLMKLLSPDQSRGLLAAMRETLEGQLQDQRERVLKQFSLDNKDGALARFITELTESQGLLSKNLHEKIDEVVREFSLDEENSALSRLVQNVDRAQRTITREFSLDEETSALFRLKRELLELLEKDRKSNREFQEEVKNALAAMAARKEEAGRSTRHGLEFEETVFEFLKREAQRLGDVATFTGNSTGLIRNCKVGDTVIELSPDSAAAGANIAVEAKEKQSYTLSKAREEIETARKNRDAQVGLFVFSERTAPDGLEPLSRYGNDVFVIWDADDSSTDVFLRAAVTLGRALCVRTQSQQAAQAADFTEIDRAILEIEKRAGALDQMTKWTSSIHENSKKLLTKLRTTRESLDRQVQTLRDKTQDLRRLLAADAKS